MINLETYQLYNTIDLDTNDKETVDRIMKKIKKCPLCKDFSFSYSLQKGIHLKFFCKEKCEICRICYDDNIRFYFDQYREDYSQNVMFDKKEFYSGGKKIC